jgi:uncharacterized membrane protein
MTDFIILIVGLARIFLGLALLLFIPGFAISLIFYPGLSEIPLIERLVFSSIASIGTAMIAIIFMDVVLGVETRVVLSVFFLVLITATCLCLWRIECIFLKKFGNTAAIHYQTRLYHASQQVSHRAIGIVKNFGERIISRIGK